jgi:putative tricarboxylic transport membrane protein
MHQGPENEDASPEVVSNRTMNIVVALALMTVATVIMVSSYRLGSGWRADIGPDSGYFPFYVALLMFIASAATLFQHLFTGRDTSDDVFIRRHELAMVFRLLIPMTIFVVLSIYIGIYISTFLFLSFFMMWIGKYPLYKTLPVAVGVPAALFVIFEIWFLVPLPKGPFEAWLGY